MVVARAVRCDRQLFGERGGFGGVFGSVAELLDDLVEEFTCGGACERQGDDTLWLLKGM